jgi:hypothetical protein
MPRSITGMDTRCTCLKIVDPPGAHPNGGFEATVPAFADEWTTLPPSIPVFADGQISPDHTVGSAIPSWDEHGDLRLVGTFRSTERATQMKQSLHEGQHTVALLFMSPSSTAPFGRELIAATVVPSW